MDRLDEALQLGLKGDYGLLQDIEQQLLHEDSFYAFYDQIFEHLPDTSEARVLTASLMIPFLEELENAYNFAEDCEDLIRLAARSCISADAPEFARVVVMSLARKASVIERFFVHIARSNDNSAKEALMRELSLHVSHFPERYDALIGALAREEKQLKYLLSSRILLFSQVEQICARLDMKRSDFTTIELLCQVRLSRIGLEKISEYIYDELRAGNLLASTMLREIVGSNGAPSFLLAEGDDFFNIFGTVCDGLFEFPNDVQLNFAEWLGDLYGYCNQLYACEILETVTMSQVERLEAHVDRLINAFFNAGFVMKHKSIKGLFSALVGIYQVMRGLSTSEILEQIFNFIDKLNEEEEIAYIYSCVEPSNYACEEADINAIFGFAMAKLFDCDDFEMASVCMKIVQDIGRKAENAKMCIRLSQTHIATFLEILQKTLDSMAQGRDEYFGKNIGSKMEYTIYNYFETNDLEMYSSFELPLFRNTEFMIPELLIYFNVAKMSNFEYLHILFSQQRLQMFLDSADLLTFEQFAEFAPFISQNIDYVSPQRLSQQCIKNLYEVLFWFISEIFAREIDHRVAELVCQLFMYHFSFAAQFFEIQPFVDYILQSALASEVSMRLFKCLVVVNPVYAKSYAFQLAKRVVFGQNMQFALQDAVDILQTYCSRKEEVIEGIFGKFNSLGEELNSFYTDTDCTDCCDLVESGVFDVKETLLRTLNQIYE